MPRKKGNPIKYGQAKQRTWKPAADKEKHQKHHSYRGMCLDELIAHVWYWRPAPRYPHGVYTQWPQCHPAPQSSEEYWFVYNVQEGKHRWDKGMLAVPMGYNGYNQSLDRGPGVEESKEFSR